MQSSETRETDFPVCAPCVYTYPVSCVAIIGPTSLSGSKFLVKIWENHRLGHLGICCLPSSQHRLVCPAPMPLCPFNMQDPCTASLGSRLNSASYYEVCSLREIPHSSRAELTSGVIQIIQTICVPVTSLMMVNSLRVENERLHFFFKLQAFYFVLGYNWWTMLW